MKMMRWLVLPVLSILTLAACAGEPSADAASEEDSYVAAEIPALEEGKYTLEGNDAVVLEIASAEEVTATATLLGRTVHLRATVTYSTFSGIERDPRWRSEDGGACQIELRVVEEGGLFSSPVLSLRSTGCDAAGSPPVDGTYRK